MPKVKMSEIKDKSENVKNVFRIPMSSRTNKFLNRQSYSSQDLIDILEISEDKEYHKDKRDFYQRLILSHKGSFSNEVVDKYADKLFHQKALLHLLENAETLTTDVKFKWLTYALSTTTQRTVFDFLKTGLSTKYGINPKQQPYTHLIIKYIIRSLKSSGYSNKLTALHEYSFELLDILNDNEKYAIYQDVIATTYESTAMQIITNYKNITPQIIEAYYKKTTISNKERLAVLSNAPEHIRQEMFDATKNPKFLNNELKDIFLIN